jgi:ferritin
MTQMNSELLLNQLCEEYGAYCEKHGLEIEGDASELLARLETQGSNEHAAWLKDFISRWEAAEVR